MLDLVIKGGTLADGTGTGIRKGDVAIQGNRIAAVEDNIDVEAAATIDAQGHLVCPGFIDSHSHSDAYILLEPTAPSKLFQGITTEVVGNCGASAAPRLGHAHLPSDWQAHAYPQSWRSMAEYRAVVEACKPAVNLVALVGHNILRASVMGYDGRPARPDELATMVRLLEESLDAGARGFSTGLIYPPGMYASPDEILALASVIARHNGVYSSHMRSEGGGLLESLDETIHVGRETGVTVQISHLKTSGRRNWPLIDRAIDTIRTAIDQGMAVRADRYPYLSSCTELDVIFPHWATEGGRNAEMARLRDPATRARLRSDILEARSEQSWGAITVGSTCAANARFRGLPLETVANTLGLPPVDAALYLIETDNLATTAFFEGMNEDNMWRILAEPWVMIGSDASLRAPAGVLSQDYPHPRAYGTFPRFLRAALDGKTVPLTEAIRKMTSLPAQQFNLARRGTLSPGFMADVVVLDLEALGDHSTYQDPHRLSTGVTDMLVNGTPVILKGALTGQRPGLWL